jgi:hypothetical protein
MSAGALSPARLPSDGTRIITSARPGRHQSRALRAGTTDRWRPSPLPGDQTLTKDVSAVSPLPARHSYIYVRVYGEARRARIQFRDVRKLAVIGLGHAGTVTAVYVTRRGHDASRADAAAKVDEICTGRSPVAGRARMHSWRARRLASMARSAWRFRPCPRPPGGVCRNRGPALAGLRPGIITAGTQAYRS